MRARSHPREPFRTAELIPGIRWVYSFDESSRVWIVGKRKWFGERRNLGDTTPDAVRLAVLPSLPVFADRGGRLILIRIGAHLYSAAHDVLLCIGSGKKVADTDRLRFDTNEFYLKTGDEMARTFPDHP